MSAKSPAPSDMGLESTLKRLEAIVEDMEDSSMDLEDALKAYTAGIELTQKAQRILSETEQKVQVLLEDNGEVSEQPFVEFEPPQ